MKKNEKNEKNEKKTKKMKKPEKKTPRGVIILFQTDRPLF